MEIISSSEMDGEKVVLHHSKVLLWYLEAKENHEESVRITICSMYIHLNTSQRHYLYRKHT
jgi:hypothetical protein